MPDGPDGESILRDLIAQVASEHDFKNYELAIKPISSGGANYSSVLFLVTVKCPGKEDVELFAKIANMGERMREVYNAKSAFDLEVFFYTKLSKTYRSLELKANVPEEYRFTFPKCYGCKSDNYEETVLLQNMTAEGFKLHDRRQPVSWEYAVSAIENLAKFHALSFAYEKDNPKEFEELCNGSVLFKYNEDAAMKEMWEKQKKSSLKIIRNYGYKLRAAKVLKNLGEDAMLDFRKPLGTKVLIHGDFRPDNMMYREKDNGVEVMTLDYQTLHIGCPAADLIFFISSATDGAFRAKYHERLMNHYYAELSAAMRRLGVDPKKAYSRETFDSELKQMLPFFLFLSMPMLRLILVDTDNIPQVDGGDAGMETFMELPTTRAFIDRQQALLNESNKIRSRPDLPCHEEFVNPPPHRLKSRHPPYQTAELLRGDFNINREWVNYWKQNIPGNIPSDFNPTKKPEGFNWPRKDWCQLNRLRTGHGRCGEFSHRCGWRDSPACDCGAPVQSMRHLILECPKRKFTGDHQDLLNLENNAAHWVKNMDIQL
ncbi:ecdysteroid kinase domain-containing protein [Phthorimaea operculella]|nr:ecdysteroid kinase domain-containing protein [Phthorimaea operculella]